LNEDGTEKYNSLSNVQLSLLERYWVCQQIRNNIIKDLDISIRYNIDIATISKWLMNLIPCNHTHTINDPIDEIGLAQIVTEYNRELVGNDEKRYSNTIMEQQQFTIERKTLYDIFH
jgi:hypothetical protein